MTFQGALFLCLAGFGASVSGFDSHIADVSLSNENGIDTCTHFDHSTSCILSPDEQVTLRFNLLVDKTISNQKLEVYFNGALLVSENICYDSRSRKVSLLPENSNNECTLPKSSTTYKVEVPFAIPYFQVSAELFFHVGEAYEVLVVFSGNQPLPPPPPPTKASPIPHPPSGLQPTSPEESDDDTNVLYGRHEELRPNSDNPPGQ